ncbi:peptidoglycan-binding domain-containing protein, partial [Streptomyces rimosus]
GQEGLRGDDRDAGPDQGLAVNNLGLSVAEAKKVQRWLKTYWGYTGAIDGKVGSGTVKALQRLLKHSWGYTGQIDGEAGKGTKAAFRRFANGI